MSSTLEDLSQLSPKRLERRLEQLARDALPCLGVNVFDGNPEDGLTVGLWVESKGRRDVLDLARVLATEAGGHVVTAWSMLSPNRRQRGWRLLLRVEFERPVLCSFVVAFDVRDHRADQLRAALPLLLAASGLAIGLDGFPRRRQPVTRVPAPTSRDCVLQLFAASR